MNEKKEGTARSLALEIAETVENLQRLPPEKRIAATYYIKGMLDSTLAETAPAQS